jgi:PadR family transcriptional regulator, regulatory protein PadR
MDDSSSKKFQKDLNGGLVGLVLRALSASNLLTSRIVPSYSGPPRRYYRITDQGRNVLAEWTAIWAGTRSFVDRFIDKGHLP